ncbi:MAG: SBBP repeat-containing protein [Bryobacteraceae bacterium]|nr:SBBP repeat-containing protein [Bryobacteraceae bacterium]
MKSRILTATCIFLAASVLGAATPGADAQPKLAASYGQPPLVFEPNHGQADAQARWLARGPGYTLFLTESEAAMALREGKGKPGSVVRMKLSGSRAWANSEGLEPTGGISNYFIGDDPSKWRTDVPHYRRVSYAGVYEGIDLVFYGSGRNVEYDFVVEPGADPRQIQLAYDGVERMEVEASTGDLVLTTASGAELRQPRPRVYQEIGGERVEVAGIYEILDRRQVTIQLAFYDAGRRLVIDPKLVYSTYLGGSQGEGVTGIAVDKYGFAYVTGTTYSDDFPTKSPIQPFQASWMPCVFVSKLGPNGSALVFSTYLGPVDVNNLFVIGKDGPGIALDSAGSAHIVASAFEGYPTRSPLQTYRGGVDAVVTKLNPKGNALEYSTYLGGSYDDLGAGIAVDAKECAYVVGVTESTNFPTKTPYQTYRGGRDAFVTKLAPRGDALVYSTYLGGSLNDMATAVTLDSAGAAYVAGSTSSTNFPLKSAYQTTRKGTGSDPWTTLDVFVTKLTPAGSALAYSTYVGGADEDRATSIAVDRYGAAYVTGYTASRNFPTKSAYQAKPAWMEDYGYQNAFVTKLTAAGNALGYSTYLGGAVADWASSIVVDNSNQAIVAGYTISWDFPTTKNAFPAEISYIKDVMAVLTRLNAAGNALVFSTYLGSHDVGDAGALACAVAMDASGFLYVGGGTSSKHFPTKQPLQNKLRSLEPWVMDAFVTKIDLR